MTTMTRKNNNLIDYMFNDFFTDEFLTKPYMFSEAKRNGQVLNRDEDWQIVFAIPGVKKDEVKIKVDDRILSVTYDNNSKNNPFSFVSSFSRSWNLEAGVDVNKIVAKHEDGILTITIPKPEAQKRVVRTIEVD